MTVREKKRLRFEGRKITKEKALAGLGNPRTWADDARAYAIKIGQQYEDEATTHEAVVSGVRTHRLNSQVSAAEMELAVEMIPNMLSPDSSTARYALVRSAGKPGSELVPGRNKSKKKPSGERKGKRGSREKKK